MKNPLIVSIFLRGRELELLHHISPFTREARRPKDRWHVEVCDKHPTWPAAEPGSLTLFLRLPPRASAERFNLKVMLAIS